MKDAVIIVVIALGLIILGKSLMNESPEQPGDTIAAPGDSHIDDSSSDSMSGSEPRFVDAATVARRFAEYKESFYELDRRILAANSGPHLRGHLVPMSKEQQTDFAKELTRCASYFNIRSRMNDGFDDPEFDMRLRVLSANFNDTAMSVISVAAENPRAIRMDLLDEEKQIFRSDINAILGARDTQRLERFKSAEEKKCLGLFEWMEIKG